MKFTFKVSKHRWYDDQFKIKLKKRGCGQLVAKHSNGSYTVCFMIYKDEDNDDGNPNCSWMWKSLITLPSADECKVWVNENIEMIVKMKLRYDDE